ncbi:MAG TPA: chemotaxis protein CheB, partial [Pyrinomonadaceae bacterium]|nr:chemotaxis protein CheB [Pyrinomonadaceae bacterium]
MSGTSGFMRQGDAERTGWKIGGDFLIVGIGASAGGIGALKEFFENVPADSGVAYVVILHLSPDHDSQLAEVLQTVARIPVTQVTEKVRVEPDHVYVVPPDRSLKLVDGHIVVQPIHTVEERRAPVDIFFRTMAETLGGRAVCVVLSGTGANGSMGLKRVKEGGGVALVQNPRQAEYSDMPRNSIATDLVDAILNVAEIPAKVVAYKNSLGRIEIPVEPEARPEEQQQALREIFTQLRVRTGHDFSSYKRSTVLRRIERRINVRELSDLPSYAAYLRESADEAQSLLKDLLISVTNFFRDKEAFAYLETQVLPRLLHGKKSDDGIRVWVAGCATGEEAYSIAMLLAERALGGLDAPEIQIFASDIDAAAIAKAREGLYTLNDAADVTPERLRRFFTKEAEGFRVRRELREMILFANHNVVKDPPFSHLDLVSCRNMIIYLNGMAQERVMEVM